MTPKPTGEAAPARLGTISLTRHGRPKIRREGWSGWNGFNAWWAAYESSDLDPTSLPPENLQQEAARATMLFMSPSQRAMETARAVCGERPVEVSELFLEAPLPAPPLPFFYMPVGVWWVISRFYWWLGFHGDFENRRETNVRAEIAADKLVEAAAKGDVLLCGHGWFNRMVGRRLKRRGWRVVYNGGDAFWGWRKYQPPE